MIDLKGKWCRLLGERLAGQLWFEDGKPMAHDPAAVQAVIDAFDPAEQLAADIAELEKVYSAAIVEHLDAEAKTYRYFSIDSACAFAATPNEFQAESQSFLVWRAAVWAHCYAVQDKAKAGLIPAPTVEELIASLPKRVLPA